jgi:uncharacterized metal-binding protein
MAPLSGGAWLALGSTPTEATINTAILVGSHLACSYWLSPDLDIDSTIDNRWGVLGIFWKPYEKLMPHRHWLSHSGLSVLLRLGYLALLVLALLLLINLLSGRNITTPLYEGALATVQTYPLQVGLFVLGAIISDAIHSITDYLSTSRKRIIRRWRLRFLLRRKRRARRAS